MDITISLCENIFDQKDFNKLNQIIKYFEFGLFIEKLRLKRHTLLKKKHKQRLLPICLQILENKWTEGWMDFKTHCHLKKSVSFVLQNCDLAQRRAFRQSESLLPSPAETRSNPGHACSRGQKCELDITYMYTQH